MKIKLLRDARINFPAGQELEVEEREAERLLSFGLAEVILEKPKKIAATKKK